MAVYKVPQDVEAEDKLLGPFSFKQFIFLIITVMSIGMAYALSQLLLPLAVIPLPLIIFFGALALPLRKDQPMEVYLAAVISFIMKPKIRLWRPDGIESLIEVIAPPSDEKLYGKGFSQEEISRRMSYLANIVDSQGWAVRGVSEPNSPMQIDLYNEAQAVDDLLDEGGARAQRIDGLLMRTDQDRRQQIMENMRNPQPVAPLPQPIAPAQPFYSPATQSQTVITPSYTPMSIIQPAEPDQNVQLVINPYPTMNQGFIAPLGDQPSSTQTPPNPVQLATQTQQTTESDTTISPANQGQPTVHQPTPVQSPPEPQQTVEPPIKEPLSPAIIDLANNHNDLSIETLRREAERIKKRELELKSQEDEVVISLR